MRVLVHLLALAAIGGLLFDTAFAETVSFSTIEGREFADATIVESDRESVVVKFSGGVIRLALEDIAKETRLELGLYVNELEVAPEDLSQLESLYQRQIEKDEGPVVKFDEKYEEALKALHGETQKKGELERLLLVNREIESFREPQERDYATFPELMRIRSIFDQKRPVAVAEVETRMAITSRLYLAKLDELKVKLTQKGDLDGAKSVAETIAKFIESRSRSTPVSDLVTSIELPGDLEDGLVLYLPLEEEEGGFVSDLGPNGYRGVLEGTTFEAAGKKKGARRFDGEDDRIVFTAPLPDMEEMTVSVWIKFEGSDENGGIFSDLSKENGNDVMFSLLGEAGIHVRADKSGARLKGNVATDAKFQGEWRHLAWVMGRDRSIVYVDGKEAGAVEMAGSNVGFHGAQLGFAHNGSRYGYFKGVIDEFLVWERALEADEVISVFEFGNP